MKSIKKFLNHVFIDGLSGMALGLFATLIVGTILGQIGSYIPGIIGTYIGYIATIAKSLMGAGIGVSIAAKFKYSPLVSVSGGVVGFIAAFSNNIVNGTFFNEAGGLAISGVGDPLSAFIAALVAIEVGNLVSGKTKLDILVTPLVTLSVGTIIAVLCGPYIYEVTAMMGDIIQFATEQQPFIMGILISVLMGIFLTLPISSVAIAVIIGLSGIAGGAAVVGCSAQMVGFAVASYRENKVGGLISQGIGTSMIQMPNIVRKPIIWLPPIITSAILGPISTCLLELSCDASGAGMGTSGLVGPLVTYSSMVEAGSEPYIVIIEIICMLFIAPAILTLAISEGMRKLKLIKFGDMKLDY
ncbi:MAG: PTS sugar transporter subunit IIC [Eubacteriales bacterium]|nr:PTS sugar transporter subunit IIC [Eubacteriales bacterium]